MKVEIEKTIESHLEEERRLRNEALRARLHEAEDFEEIMRLLAALKPRKEEACA